MEDESQILNSSTECASDDRISLSSSHDELVPLIPSQNLLAQSFINDASVKMVKQTNCIYFEYQIFIHNLFSLAGFKLREWLHWKYTFT